MLVIEECKAMADDLSRHLVFDGTFSCDLFFQIAALDSWRMRYFALGRIYVEFGWRIGRKMVPDEYVSIGGPCFLNVLHKYLVT